MRDSTPREAIVFVSKERAFFVHSGRKSINQDRGLQEDSASLGPYLRSRGVSFSAVSPVGVRSQQHNALVAKACRDFALARSWSAATREFVSLQRPVRPSPGDSLAVSPHA